MRTTSVCGAQLYTYYCKFKNYLEVNHCPKRNHMNPLCLQTDWVNFMQILCLFEILTQTYMKQPLAGAIWQKFCVKRFGKYVLKKNGLYYKNS